MQQNDRKFSMEERLLRQIIKDSDGFLLAETMFAVVLLLVSSIAIIGLFLQAYRANRVALDTCFAVDLAKQQVEDVKYQVEDSTAAMNSSYNDLSSYPVHKIVTLDFGGKTFTADVNVRPQGSEAAGDEDYTNLLVLVNVRVSWIEFGDYRKIEFVTYCLRNRAYSVFPRPVGAGG